MPDFFCKADINQRVKLRVHGDEIDAEGLGRQRPRRLNLGAEQIRRHRPAGESAEASAIGNRGDEVAFGHPAHRAAHNGERRAEEIRPPLPEGL